MKTTTEADWAWAAGLFEGEGSVGAYRRRREGGRPFATLALGSTDRDVVMRFAAIVGGPTPRVYHDKRGHKPIWHWAGHGWDFMLAVFTRFAPYLGERRTRQFMAALDAEPEGRQGKTHCVHGHAFTPENTYTWRNARHCRACRATIDQKRRRTAAKGVG